MDDRLDLSRLEQLQGPLAAGVPAIIAQLVQETTTEIAQIEAALLAADPVSAARAAHAARNSVLMFGAQPLLDTLETLEEAAGRGELPAARDAFARLRAIWPEIRQELERRAQPPPG
jgi:HPt (histidine-containing phosphotransfer) domain-containing protein